MARSQLVVSYETQIKLLVEELLGRQKEWADLMQHEVRRCRRDAAANGGEWGWPAPEMADLGTSPTATAAAAAAATATADQIWRIIIFYCRLQLFF